MATALVHDALLPLASAVFAGGLIGLEREWRGRAAGLRTHILVSLASALLMRAAMAQADWAFRALPDENIVTDPTRMAHGVLTGVGFLCAGVIFRTGFSIHGLTTAASLWTTASLGLLFGAGLYELGVAGTATTALVLAGLRLVSRKLPAPMVIDVEASWRRGLTSPEGQLEAALRATDAACRPERFELVDGGAMVRRSWKLKVPDEDQMRRLAGSLTAIEGLSAIRLKPRDD